MNSQPEMRACVNFLADIYDEGGANILCDKRDPIYLFRTHFLIGYFNEKEAVTKRCSDVIKDVLNVLDVWRLNG